MLARPFHAGLTVVEERQRTPSRRRVIVNKLPWVDYEFRVFDRDAGTYLMDRIPFSVHAPPVEGALSLAKTTFVVGEKMTLGVALPDNRYYDSATRASAGS